jgi:type I restriction enzyme R subunit
MGTEFDFTENPSIKYLQSLGYDYLDGKQSIDNRDGLNNVILKDTLKEALIRINDIPEDIASSIYTELLTISDNERWTQLLRGDYSKTVPGEATKKTIQLIDFLDISNNSLTVSSQFSVQAEKTSRPDLICFVNGIPLVVIELKSPVSFKDKTGEAFEQMKRYEKDAPRLFYSNLFNIISNGEYVLYGATGSPSEYWGEWKDPWPATLEDFSTALQKGLYSVLEPSRLLDILAHFIVFEKRDGQVTKKICRYQQYRAVNKIVNRFLEDRAAKDRRGLIWHTQGSGKSLTMVFTVLKLKKHLNIQAGKITSPNILIVTDRIDLDTQIVGTFTACGLPNPTSISSVSDLHESIHADTNGLTLLSTIFKFEGSRKPVENSGNWIICIDESHRTQEKDLGAYLRTTFPEAWFFGFTGTPIKKTDKNTYRNFSPEGEMYLDKYSIDDAVADGATIPIHYTSRMAKWQVNAAEIDILFDQWFADLSEEKREAVKQKELTTATLLKHQKRVQLIARDMWEHFKASAMPDGYKAQVVAIDREAIILYKKAFNKIIAKELLEKGSSYEEAEAAADSYTVPVYSSNQQDQNVSEDPYVMEVREALVKYALSDEKSTRFTTYNSANPTEKEVKNAFKKKGEPPYILIVCSKLLTGFDAPVESIMYLDNPLKEHNLLQAIARTNRVEGSNKPNGLIVDYVGITRNLTEALSSYRKEDIQNALHNIDDLRQELKQSHVEVMTFIRSMKRTADPSKEQIQHEAYTFLDQLETEDKWLSFKRKANAFIKAYSALSPDSYILEFTRDLKWVALLIPLGTQRFEKNESSDLKSYTGKIREMLAKELEVTGIANVVKIRSLTDPEYWNDFDTNDKSEEELKTSAVRKATELKKTISEKLRDNDVQYSPFSDRLKEIIQRLEEQQVDFAQILKEQEELSKALEDEEKAHESAHISKEAYGVYTILKAFKPPQETSEGAEAGGDGGLEGLSEEKLSALKEVAVQIDELYSSSDTAPNGWHLKEVMRKELRQQVRMMVFPLQLDDWKTIPTKVEEYALKNYAR